MKKETKMWLTFIFVIAFFSFVFGMILGEQTQMLSVELPKNVTLQGDHRYSIGQNTLQVCDCGETVVYTAINNNNTDNGEKEDVWCNAYRNLMNKKR